MNFRRLHQIAIYIAIASTLGVYGCSKSDLDEVQIHQRVTGDPIKGQYMVVFKTHIADGSSQSVESTTLSSFSKLRQQIFNDIDLNSSYVRNTFSGATNGFTALLNDAQFESLRKRPDIAVLEPDRYITLAKPTNQIRDIKEGKTNTLPVDIALPYSTFIPKDGEHVPWHIERVGYGDGTGKTVWVIDSGVDPDHPDLNIDIPRSRSFIFGVSSIRDGFGHGTKVAGIIAAKNNGSGMIGIAANATVVVLRIFDDAGQGTTSRVVSAVNYVVANGTPGDVVNISLGTNISSTLDETVKIAAERGFRFSIAAGNSAMDCASVSPARLNAPNVYTISAVNTFNQLWEYSNFGLSIDYAAPGVNITSTAVNGGLVSGISGTSYAAPHVSGILLLRPDIVSRGHVIDDKDSVPEPIASAK
jgi:subtilisin family serine protease